jgi:UDP-N-acetylmuramoyl-tripeptide--D-alanyl-D-alanine ligase
MTWTAADIAELVRGELHADPTTPVSGVTTDSRNVGVDDAFVAIVGEQFDGADFASDAMASGASIVVAQRRVDQPCIVVKDTTAALGAIARAHLQALPRTRVIAITGSSGKTSTKDLVAQMLSRAGTTVASVGSFNNEVGLPRTVLQADDRTQFLVLEMGMRGGGQIAHLCDIAPPDIAVVLNVGTAHAGVIGSMDDTAAGKGEIIRALHGDGLAIINRDDAYAHYFSSLAPCPTLEFGLDEGFVHASGIELDDMARASFTLHIGDASAPVRLRTLGEHHVGNALAAAAIGHACGMNVTTIAQALSDATPRSHGRMECVELDNGVTLIDDTYNANPESMRSALRALAMIGRHRRTWAVLGEMRELGERAVEEHDAIGRLAVRLDISHLVAVGQMGKIMQIGAANEGSWGDEAAHVPDAEAAARYVLDRWHEGDVVLIKASRSIRLERVAEALRAAGSRKD